MSLSDKEIERRKDNANKLVKEGKIGGSEFGKLGGRPRKRRANEEVAEAAREHIEAVIDSFVSAMDPKQPPYVRMQAAKELLKIEQLETERQDKLVSNEGDEDSIIEQLEEVFGKIRNQRGSIPGELVGIEPNGTEEAS